MRSISIRSKTFGSCISTLILKLFSSIQDNSVQLWVIEFNLGGSQLSYLVHLKVIYRIQVIKTCFKVGFFLST